MLDRETQPPNQTASVQGQPSTRPIAAADAHRQQDLDGRAQQGHVPHRAQFLQGELDAQGEQQQGDADLRQQFDVVGVGDEGAAGHRPQDDAGGDVAQDQRLLEALGDDTAQESCGDDDRDVCGDSQISPKPGGLLESSNGPDRRVYLLIPGTSKKFG